MAIYVGRNKITGRKRTNAPLKKSRIRAKKYKAAKKKKAVVRKRSIKAYNARFAKSNTKKAAKKRAAAIKRTKQKKAAARKRSIKAYNARFRKKYGVKPKSKKGKAIRKAVKTNVSRARRGLPRRKVSTKAINARKRKASMSKGKVGGGGKGKAAPKKKKASKPKYPGALNAAQRKKIANEANSLAKEQYLPALQELARQMKSVERDRDRNVGVQTEFGKLGDERLAAAGGWLDQVLSRQAGVTGEIYDKASSNIQSGYAGAKEAGAKAGRQVLAGMQGDAEALGLTEALDTPTSRLKSEIMAAQAEVEGDYARANENIQTLGASEASRAQDTVGTAARQSVQDRGDLQTQVAGGIAGIQRQAGEQLAEGAQARVDLKSQQGLSAKNLYRQLRTETQDRRRQGFMDKLYAEVQRNTMKLQNAQLGLEKQAQKFNQRLAKGQLNLQRNQFSFDKKLAKQQLRNEKAALQAEIAASNDPLIRERARLELKKIQADINLVNSQTAKNLGSAGPKKWKSSLAKGRRKAWNASSARFAGRYGS